MDPIDGKETKFSSHQSIPLDNVNNTQVTLVTGTRLALVFSAFLVSFALVAFDQTILATALPKIASHFNAVSDLSWIASAYFLPQAAFMLFFGSVLSIVPAKPVFLFSVTVFEIGSLLCAVAPSVSVLILGRAVSGFGASGLWVSIMTTVGRVTTMAQRPILMGLFGAMFAVASVVGPLIGGVFADHVTWRGGVFLGAISMLAILFFLPSQPSLVQDKSQWQRWLHLDWIGTFFSLSMVTTLLLALQWGGNTKPWSDPGVIVCLVLFVLFLVAFVAWEHKRGPNAILPLKMLLQRSMLGAFLASAFIQLAFVVAVYYLPLLYQVRGHSATNSGLDILPFMISGVIATMAVGGMVSVTGLAWPFLLFFPLIASVGFGLLFTADLDTTSTRLLGYQILVGLGLGAVVQITLVIAQAEYVNDEVLVPRATSSITFTQVLGSSIGLAIAGSIFSSQLRVQLTRYAPSLSQQSALAVLSSVEAIFSLPPDQMTSVKQAYTAAIDKVMIAGVPFMMSASASAILITRKKLEQTPTGVNL